MNLISILSFCDNIDVLKVMRLVNLAIRIITIIVPIILIVMLMIDMTSVMLKDDKDALSKTLKSSVKKLIAAIVIFMIPTLVYLIVDIVSGDDEEIKTCLTVRSYEDLVELESQKAQQYVERAKTSLSYNDYYAAYGIVMRISDKDVQKDLLDELNEIKDEIIPDNPGGAPISTSNVSTYTNNKNGLTFKLYDQGDSRWGSMVYENLDNKPTISQIGCMITSVAVVSSSINANVTPLTVFNGENTARHQEPHTSIPQLTNNVLSCSNTGQISKSTLQNSLKEGKIVVVHVGTGPFTSLSSHYMALIDIKEDGNNVLVGNSHINDGGNSAATWYKIDDVFVNLKGSYTCHK